MLAAARVQANAAQAVLFGLGTKRSVEPPPLYAFDPDVGRLAVTTPAYNTAVVAVNRGAFPYGGIDLARLFDGQQDVAGGVGGRPPASFGVVVRDGGGRIVLASQRAVTSVRAAEGARAARSTRAPYAGPFSRLRVAGDPSSSGGMSIKTTHIFTASYIETEWRVTGAGVAGRSRSCSRRWGAGAQVTAVSAVRRAAVRRRGRCRWTTSRGSTSSPSTRATSSSSAAAGSPRRRSGRGAVLSAPPGPDLDGASLGVRRRGADRAGPDGRGGGGGGRSACGADVRASRAAAALAAHRVVSAWRRRRGRFAAGTASRDVRPPSRRSLRDASAPCRVSLDRRGPLR